MALTCCLYSPVMGRCSLTVLAVAEPTVCERLSLGETAEFHWRHFGLEGILREQLKWQQLDDAREQEKKRGCSEQRKKEEGKEYWPKWEES